DKVAELEASDPGNAGFTKLRTDLEEVIRLTRGLIEEAQGKSALPPPPAKSVSDVVKAEAAPIGKWEPVPPPDATGASSAAREGGGASAGHEGGIGAGVFGVGARVEVLSGDKWYPAVIKKASEDGQDFEVTYMGFGTEGSATITTLRQITRSSRPVVAAAAVKGLECRALYVGDGVYYDCEIQEVTQNGYKVAFTAYGNVEEVPLEYLQRRVVVSQGKAKQAETSAEAEASFVVPESLRPQEGDTEIERERKRKKIKALKSRFKLKQKDAVVNNKQASWQAFQTKGAKKKAKGSMAAVTTKTGSIFASPEGLGGKVGVTGSGQGLTEQAPRKKFRTKLEK
ncbi:unnamed protein product, partial [Ascophyllum nodosum]